MRAVAIIIAMLLLAQPGMAREGPGLVGPDNFFYPLKIWMEKLSVNFISNQTEKTHRMLDLAEERLNEAERIKNDSRAFERAMEEYAVQLEELQSIITKDTLNETENIHINITEKIEDHLKRTEALKSKGNISIIQKSIIEASSSAGESRIKVSVANGNVSVETEGGDPVITRDGNNVNVISVTNNSKQQVIVRSSGNTSSSSSIVIAQSSSNAVIDN